MIMLVFSKRFIILVEFYILLSINKFKHLLQKFSVAISSEGERCIHFGNLPLASFPLNKIVVMY